MSTPDTTKQIIEEYVKEDADALHCSVFTPSVTADDELDDHWQMLEESWLSSKSLSLESIKCFSSQWFNDLESMI